MPQRLSIAGILSHERICSFDALAQDDLFNPFLARQEVKEYLETPLGEIVSDMTVLAAVEFGLVRVVYATSGAVDSVPLPLGIRRQDARLALVRYDTTDTKPCETAQRILNGDIRPQDLFLFTGDLQKYQILCEPEYQSLEEGLAALPGLVKQRLNAAKYLAQDLLEGMWADFQQLVWRLRLLVMLEAKEGGSKEAEMREAMRSFRNDWGHNVDLLTPPPFNPISPPTGSRGPLLPLS